MIPKDMMTKLKADPFLLWLYARRIVIVKITVVVIIMIAAGFVRRHIFWLPHWGGDASHYVSLAMKINDEGMKGYNLRGVDAHHLIASHDPLTAAVYLSKSAPGDEGNFLSAMKHHGYGYYDVPLFWKPPLFSYLIIFSHRIFMQEGSRYSVILRSAKESIDAVGADFFIDNQFYAAIVPFAFGLLSVFMTFLLGWKMYSYRIGVYASSMLALNAVGILTSSNIWTEEVAVFLILSAVWFYYYHNKSQCMKYLIFAGVLTGLAVLTKVSSLIMLIPVILSLCLWQPGERGPGNQTDYKKIMSKIFIFLTCVLLIAGGWFIMICKQYGNPLFTPNFPHIAGENTAWSTLLEKRPPSYILYPVGIVFIYPLFLIGLMVVTNILSVKRAHHKSPRAVVFIQMWFLSYLVIFILTGGKEHRYLYPAYPALAIATSIALSRCHWYLSQKKKGSFIPELLIVLLIFLSGVWSAKLGLLSVVDYRSLLLHYPF